MPDCATSCFETPSGTPLTEPRPCQIHIRIQLCPAHNTRSNFSKGSLRVRESEPLTLPALFIGTKRAPACRTTDKISHGIQKRPPKKKIPPLFIGTKRAVAELLTKFLAGSGPPKIPPTDTPRQLEFKWRSAAPRFHRASSLPACACIQTDR